MNADPFAPLPREPQHASPGNGGSKPADWAPELPAPE